MTATVSHNGWEVEVAAFTFRLACHRISIVQNAAYLLFEVDSDGQRRITRASGGGLNVRYPRTAVVHPLMGSVAASTLPARRSR